MMSYEDEEIEESTTTASQTMHLNEDENMKIQEFDVILK
jgi:hypothetical protein